MKPGAFVCLAGVWPDPLSLPMERFVEEFSLVFATFGPGVLSLAGDFILGPFAFINVSVLENAFSFAMSCLFVPLTGINSTVCVFKCADF
jgi:hypothetical protein